MQGLEGDVLAAEYCVVSSRAKVRTDSLRRMFPDFPHQLRHCIPIASASSFIQLQDVLGRFSWFALPIEY